PRLHAPGGTLPRSGGARPRALPGPRRACAARGRPALGRLSAAGHARAPRRTGVRRDGEPLRRPKLGALVSEFEGGTAGGADGIDHSAGLVSRALRDGGHLLRLLFLFVLGALAFVVAQRLLVPKGFGTLGHYRPGALADSRSFPVVFAGRAACEECH